MKLSDIAARLSCTLEGDGDIEINHVAGLQDAGAGALTGSRVLEKLGL